MAKANLNITLVQPRLLRQSEAADYVGLAATHFKADCPVLPVELRPGELRWDKHDLDLWVDQLKEGAAEMSRDAILSRLRNSKDEAEK